MAEIIDLTVSPSRPEVIEISSDQETPGRRIRTQENKKREKKRKKTPNGLASDSGIGSSAQPSRAPSHSPETGNKHSDVNDPSTPHPTKPQALHSIPSSTIDVPDLFFFDAAAAFVTVEDFSPTPEPTESNGDCSKLLLPSHVAVSCDDGSIVAEVIPPPKTSSDDEDYIEYLDYEDRKAPGLVRYFEVEGEESGQSRPSIFKCKNCGAEGDHKSFECPIQICLTCGARDEHSTRSCPISKTCYACGMKGHINKTCPNRFSAYATSSDLHSDCDRCGSTEHKMNECPTLWRIYQYVNDEERIMIMRSRVEKNHLAIGEGGEGYIGEEMWCYNCANTGHLGDDCDELPYPANFPTENSAFSSHNVVSGPFYDPATEPVVAKRGSRDRPRLQDDWEAGAPVDVGKRGKNKDKERLGKRFREQEDDGDDWFNNTRGVKRKGKDQQAPLPGSRGKTFKFGLIKDGGHEPASPPPSLPTNANGPSLLARLSDPGTKGKNRGKGDRGRERHESSYQSENSFRIRGAATDQRDQDGRYATSSSRKTDWGREQDRRDRNKSGHGGSRRGHGPRYKGGYDR